MVDRARWSLSLGIMNRLGIGFRTLVNTAWWILAAMFVFFLLQQTNNDDAVIRVLNAGQVDFKDYIVSIGIVLAIALVEAVSFSILIRYLLFRSSLSWLCADLHSVIPLKQTGEVIVLEGLRAEMDFIVLLAVSVLAVWANQYNQYMYLSELAMDYIGSPYTLLVLLYACARGISVWGVYSIHVSPDLVIAEGLPFQGCKQIGRISHMSGGIQIGKQSELVMLEFTNGRRRCVMYSPKEIAKMRLLLKVV